MQCRIQVRQICLSASQESPTIGHGFAQMRGCGLWIRSSGSGGCGKGLGRVRGRQVQWVFVEVGFSSASVKRGRRLGGGGGDCSSADLEALWQQRRGGWPDGEGVWRGPRIGTMLGGVFLWPKEQSEDQSQETRSGECDFPLDRCVPGGKKVREVASVGLLLQQKEVTLAERHAVWGELRREEQESLWLATTRASSSGPSVLSLPARTTNTTDATGQAECGLQPVFPRWAVADGRSLGGVQYSTVVQVTVVARETEPREGPGPRRETERSKLQTEQKKTNQDGRKLTMLIE
jgi:hypothetical protein